jgi:hypothetical protein
LCPKAFWYEKRSKRNTIEYEDDDKGVEDMVDAFHEESKDMVIEMMDARKRNVSKLFF